MSRRAAHLSSPQSDAHATDVDVTDDESGMPRHHRTNTYDDLHKAAELGLVLSRLNEELTGENAELTAECERLRISTEETSHELVLARAAKIEVLQQVEDLQRDNLRLSEDARILEFERVKLASRLKEAEDRAAWYQSQLEYHKQVSDEMKRNLEETQNHIVAVCGDRDKLAAELASYRADASGGSSLPGTPRESATVTAAGDLHGPDVGTLLDRLQKENSQIHSLRESVVLLERQLAAKSDEFTALQAKHVHLNDSERELREMLDAFRRDGYMRGSDGEDEDGSGSAKESRPRRSSKPGLATNMLSELTLKSYQLDQHQQRQKLEALERSVQTLTEENRMLMQHLKDVRKSGGRMKARTMNPRASLVVGGVGLSGGRGLVSHKAPPPPPPLPVEATTNSNPSSPREAPRLLSEATPPKASPGEPAPATVRKHFRSESTPCDVGPSADVSPLAPPPIPFADAPPRFPAALEVVTLAGVLLDSSATRSVLERPSAVTTGTVDSTLLSVSYAEGAESSAQDVMSLPIVSALTSLMSWAEKDLGVGLAELADAISSSVTAPVPKLIGDIIKECSRLSASFHLRREASYEDDLVQAADDAESSYASEGGEHSVEASPLYQLKVHLIMVSAALRLAQSITPKLSMFTVKHFMRCQRAADPASDRVVFAPPGLPSTRASLSSAANSPEPLSRSLAVSTPDSEGPPTISSARSTPESRSPGPVLPLPPAPVLSVDGIGGVGNSTRRVKVGAVSGAEVFTPHRLPPPGPRSHPGTVDDRAPPSASVSLMSISKTTPFARSMADPMNVFKGARNASAQDMFERLSVFTQGCLLQYSSQWQGSLLTITQLGMYNRPHVPKWVADDIKDACSQCSTPFSLTTRRHHCRSCGDLFCSKCSSSFLDFSRLCLVGGGGGSGPPDPQRVCTQCCVRLQQLPSPSRGHVRPSFN